MPKQNDNTIRFRCMQRSVARPTIPREHLGRRGSATQTRPLPWRPLPVDAHATERRPPFPHAVHTPIFRTVFRAPDDESTAGQGLLAWLSARFSYYDTGQWCAAVNAGHVTVNGARTAPDHTLAEGDVVVYAPKTTDEPEPLPAGLALVLVDPEFVIVDKPAGVVVHRHSAFPGRTFVPALEAQLGGMLEPAHRLDRETSGVLLLARTTAAFRALQRQFEARTVEKRYLAVARGAVAWREHTLDAPIGPHPASAVAARRAVLAARSAGARAATTAFRALGRVGDDTLVEARPTTGRTHQIRVHLEHLGHAIVGDPLYGRSDADYLEHTARLKRGERPPGRLLLHAASLTFVHPQTGATVHAQAPPPPGFAADGTCSSPRG
jgi:23S rRNA pseudouridine1911/1915/1917 synthase